MSSKKTILTVPGPILPGTVSIARAKCGNSNCRCNDNPKYLHGPYFRWTGWINGKPTTKTISQEVATECKKRIRNYKKLQKNLEVAIAVALDQAPWITPKK